MELQIGQVPLNCSLELFWLVVLIVNLLVSFNTEAFNKFEEGSLELAAAVMHLPRLFLVLKHEAGEPLGYLVRIILAEYLVHFLICSLQPGAIYLLLALVWLREAVKTAEANIIAVALELVQGTLVSILVRLATLPLLPLVALRETYVHLVFRVCAKSLQILTIDAHILLRVLRIGIANTHSIEIGGYGAFREAWWSLRVRLFLNRAFLGFKGQALCTLDVFVTLGLAQISLSCLVIRLSRLVTRDVDATLYDDLARAVAAGMRIPHLYVGYVV